MVIGIFYFAVFIGSDRPLLQCEIADISPFFPSFCSFHATYTRERDS